MYEQTKTKPYMIAENLKTKDKSVCENKIKDQRQKHKTTVKEEHSQ